MALGAALFLNLHEFIKKNAAIRIIKNSFTKYIRRRNWFVRYNVIQLIKVEDLFPF